MFERPAAGNRALLVQVDFGQGQIDERLSEITLLAESAGATVVGVVHAKRSAPDPAHFVGKGKADEIGTTAQLYEADIVIFNHDITAAQQRNLERKFNCRVVDRSALILDIFALRAKSHEGKLQVELAQLQHLSTRLVRGWTHLERQKGGIGLRGPGEKQLETDRRLLGERVKLLKSRLATLERQRAVRRRARERRDVMSISLVGYTNAGKSTLFNALTKAGAYAADQLFATLDTTSRRLFLGEAGSVVLSDTVGFIRDLPHSLVAAFHATLEETVSADLLLHDHRDDEAVGDLLETGARLVAGVLPTTSPLSDVRASVEVVRDLGHRLGHDPDSIARRVLVSPSCGLAGSSPDHVRAVLRTLPAVGRGLREEEARHGQG